MTRTANAYLDATLVAVADLDRALGRLARELRSVGAIDLAADARASIGRGYTAEGRAAARAVAYWGGHACPLMVEPADAVRAALLDLEELTA